MDDHPTMTAISSAVDDHSTRVTFTSAIDDHTTSSTSLIVSGDNGVPDILSSAIDCIPTSSEALSTIAGIHPAQADWCTVAGAHRTLIFTSPDDDNRSTDISSFSVEASTSRVSPTVGSVVGSCSPSEIPPYPAAQRSVTARKRIAMRAEIITASPYKNAVKAKKILKDIAISKKKKRERKKTCREDAKKRLSFPKAPKPLIAMKNCKKSSEGHLIKNTRNGKKSVVRCGTGQRESKMETNYKEVTCTGCEEIGGAEDWVQCSYCNSWWHTACSAYVGDGAFRCDLC